MEQIRSPQNKPTNLQASNFYQGDKKKNAVEKVYLTNVIGKTGFPPAEVIN